MDGEIRRFTIIFIILILLVIAVFFPTVNRHDVRKLESLYYESPAYFVLDDAYITYRYAKHLVTVGVPVWNKNRDPVEGYTSFSWVVINAAFIALNMDPVLGSKIVSFAAVLLIVFELLCFRSNSSSHRSLVRLVFILGIVLNPSFVLVTLQGMETGLAAFLTLSGTLLFLTSYEKSSTDRFVLPGLFLVVLLSVLTRPELASYWLIPLLGLWYVYWDSPGKRFSLFCAYLTVFLLLPGVVYFAWRWWFFGQLMPNAASIKGSASVGLLSVIYNTSFVFDFALTYFLLFVLSGLICVWFRFDTLAPLLCVFFGVLLFLGALLFFSPIQGYLWRFQMPVYPVILLLCILSAEALLSGLEDASLGQPTVFNRSALLFLVVCIFVFMSLFPFKTYFRVKVEMGNRWQYDRVQVGKSLGEIADSNATMLTTEAGALSFYSGWKTYDYLGLTSEYIAKRGVDLPFLQRTNPDLIAYGTDTPSILSGLRRLFPEQAYSFVRENYCHVASIHKSSPDLRITNDSVHSYFVNKNSPFRSRLREVLRNVNDVKYYSRKRNLLCE